MARRAIKINSREKAMNSKINSVLCGLLSALAFLSLSVAIALGAPGSEALAQEPSDYMGSDSVFPVLEEKDFVDFLDIMAASEADDDLGLLLAKKNISREHATAVTITIFTNAMATDHRVLEEAVGELGPSVVFNDSEKRLLEKYGDRIRKAFA
jgi:hypothetical protein